MMEARYIRNIPALSEEECNLLKRKKIGIVGCGGLGGHLIELFSRLGIGSLRVIDGDVFEISNLNRQLLSSSDLLGTEKAAAAAVHIARINPDIQTEYFVSFLDESNAETLIQGCDVILDALDNISSRKILANACSNLNIPYIYGAIRGWVAQAGISMPGDNLIHLLYPKDDIPLNDKSVLSFTPALCASIQASLCVKLLVGRPVTTGTLYYFDLLDYEFETIPFH